ncbi:hypothetical protein [Paractinoplanes abujensis]|uniref:Uncharacterized protein n=1 Tax=Paractinoplanes abujensis TaxID=882441 RepID=A0A7W7G512_9ACTN|nr:hypothetical protein [Actinoplanes abujensis]MBB4697943.1 hypothetical protein [Actinoplanes abujensis]
MAALRANHGFALLGLRYAAVAGAVYAVLGATAGPDSLCASFTGAAVFAAAGFLAGESGWLEFRLVHMTFAVRWHRAATSQGKRHVADLPTYLMRFITYVSLVEFGLLRVNGPYWAFRHQIVADHLESAAEIAEPLKATLK